MSSLDISGIDTVLANVDYIVDKYDKDIKKVFQETGKLWVREAKSRARVRTGRMRASVQFIATEYGGLGIVPVNYARWVEFGTRRSRAYPFALPAFAIAKRYLWTELRKL
jgi:HK97 gp10 family phage protein